MLQYVCIQDSQKRQANAATVTPFPTKHNYGNGLSSSTQQMKEITRQQLSSLRKLIKHERLSDFHFVLSIFRKRRRAEVFMRFLYGLIWRLHVSQNADLFSFVRSASSSFKKMTLRKGWRIHSRQIENNSFKLNYREMTELS